MIDDDDDDDDDDDAESLRRHYHIRRLKRSLKRRRYKDRRFFRDWFSGFFSGNENTNSQSKDLFDWRTKSVVSKVKNQGSCGSCYAFATTAVLETLYATKRRSRNIIEFSPQQITDCSNYGNYGCNGGNFVPSLRYLSRQGGKIATEASYPYVGRRTICRTSGIRQIPLGNIQYGAIPHGNEKKMAEALVTYGPLFIGLDADSKLFMFYKSGVLKINNCPNRLQDMDHAMALVGYGFDSGVNMPYWIIKNSWGTSWGEKGYLRLAKDAGNMCGVASMAYYAKLT